MLLATVQVCPVNFWQAGTGLTRAGKYARLSVLKRWQSGKPITLA
jgi:hypothetical protein